MCTLSTDHIAQDPAGAWQLFLQAIKAGEAVVVTENNRLLATINPTIEIESQDSSPFQAVRALKKSSSTGIENQEIRAWLDETRE